MKNIEFLYALSPFQESHGIMLLCHTSDAMRMIGIFCNIRLIIKSIFLSLLILLATLYNHALKSCNTIVFRFAILCMFM